MRSERLGYGMRKRPECDSVLEAAARSKIESFNDRSVHVYTYTTCT